MWDKICSWFKNSETIFLARLQVFAGIVLGVVVTTDPTLFQATIPSQYWPFFLIGWGVLTEVARRRHDPYINQTGQ